jgi:hypothetical protein
MRLAADGADARHDVRHVVEAVATHEGFEEARAFGGLHFDPGFPGVGDFNEEVAVSFDAG